MNVLSLENQVKIVSLLTEGVSGRAIERLTGVHRDSIGSLLQRVGSGCAALHHENVRNLSVNRIEVDEIHAIVGKHSKNIKNGDPCWAGAQYTHIALAEASRLIITYCVGRRTADVTSDFIEDLRSRVIGSPEISSDGHAPYTQAVREFFGEDVAYGQVLKNEQFYMPKHKGQRLPRSIGGAPAQKIVKSGQPEHISTSLIERQNLTLRMGSSRLRRSSTTHSKTMRRHLAAIALHVGHYNYYRHHETLKTTPAVAQGLEERPWRLEDFVTRALAKSAEYEIQFQEPIKEEPGMARIRSIKPEFWTSEQIMECSTNARLMFIGMWNFADDHGRLPYSAKSIKAQIFPSDSFSLDTIQGMVSELSANGLVLSYSIEGKEFLQITGWAHQRIDKPQPAKYPPPLLEHSTNAPRTLPPDRIGEDKTGKKESCPVAKATRTVVTYSDEFETSFWKPFPRTAIMSKKEAWREWMKLDPVQRLAACQAIEPYRRHLTKNPTLHAVHACRFLSQNRAEGILEIAAEKPKFDVRAHLV